MIRLIPVLDVLNGVVVRGVAGRRHEYRPIISQLTSSTRPLDVAVALTDAFRPPALYVADLDAIQQRCFSPTLYQQLAVLGVPVWVDAGVRTPDEARPLWEAGGHVVAGLEVLPNEATLRTLVEAVPCERLLFSLDMRDGVPWHSWGCTSSQMVERVVVLGITRVIVLDIARVGTGVGPGPLDLLRELRTQFPHIELIAAGGVNSAADVATLDALGMDGVLVASALHDGRITRSMLANHREHE